MIKNTSCIFLLVLFCLLGNSANAKSEDLVAAIDSAIKQAVESRPAGSGVPHLLSFDNIVGDYIPIGATVEEMIKVLDKSNLQAILAPKKVTPGDVELRYNVYFTSRVYNLIFARYDVTVLVDVSRGVVVSTLAVAVFRTF